MGSKILGYVERKITDKVTKPNSFKTGRYLGGTESVLVHETRRLRVPHESSKGDGSDDMANLYNEAAPPDPTKASAEEKKPGESLKGDGSIDTANSYNETTLLDPTKISAEEKKPNESLKENGPDDTAKSDNEAASPTKASAEEDKPTDLEEA